MTLAPDPLTQLAIFHGTDKWGLHFYTPIYHSLFESLRDRPVRLLEIGVGGYDLARVGGASLAMWADYFPNGHIVGLDVYEKQLDFGPRVVVRRGSQDEPSVLNALVEEFGPFDIVIDDGSHVPHHVVTSFVELFPRMSKAGLYVIEDVQTSFWPLFGGSSPDGGETLQLALSVLLSLNRNEITLGAPDWQEPVFARHVRSLRAFHNLLVVEHGDNDEPSSESFSLNSPLAAHAVTFIEQEMDRAPSAAGVANLARVLFRAGERDRAASLLETALSRWPDSSEVLWVAIEVFPDPSVRLALVDKLASLEPDPTSPGLQRIRANIERR